jgi:NAD(P)-dependent dehydrogenase (short-subunit alcohol dehydrogenase family)
MTIHYRIDASSNRITTRVFGEVTINEALQHFDELSADSSYEPDLDVLLDLTDCKTLLDADQIRTAAARATADLSTLRFGRMAIVVASDALFGMLRMFHTLSESAFSAAQIFRDRDEALQWLGESGPTH